VLIILGGLAGVGKTTIARELARVIGAVHIRIDSIEQAIVGANVLAGSIEDAGYRVGYAVAEDNLRLGRTVIADSVNPWPITREAWRDVARTADVRAIEVEVTCSDAFEHRRRVEERLVATGANRPTWQDVLARDYRPWDGDHLIVDTAAQSIDVIVTMIRAARDARATE
jgi:predicted kinase